jgi:hypothetical protein
VGSRPPSVFRGVRFTSRPVDQLFSLNPLFSSYSLPETVPLPYVYITPQSHAPVHSSPYHPTIYWQDFSAIRTICYRRFRAPSSAEHWQLLRNRRRQFAKVFNCIPGLILQILMKLQLSLFDTVQEIRQEATPSIFLQVHAFRHNAKRPDETTFQFSVFTLTFPNSAQGIDTKH